MVIRIGKYHGANIQIDRGADRASKWLCAVIWYRKEPNRLGYLYQSVPANLAALKLLFS